MQIVESWYHVPMQFCCRCNISRTVYLESVRGRARVVWEGSSERWKQKEIDWNVLLCVKSFSPLQILSTLYLPFPSKFLNIFLGIYKSLLNRHRSKQQSWTLNTNSLICYSSFAALEIGQQVLHPHLNFLKVPNRCIHVSLLHF